ncbi:MAG: circadian clock KaiB family protein [Gemmatimonadales bacterium]|nr:circadian clock KaiB family protein [Gemmatimonadales bacterium]
MNLAYRFTLFVTGQTPRSQRAIANLRALCEEQLPGAYELNVVDVLEQPDLAERARVLATPTLVKDLPPPPRRVIGDLSDRQRVLFGLDLELPAGGLGEASA